MDVVRVQLKRHSVTQKVREMRHILLFQRRIREHKQRDSLDVAVDNVVDLRQTPSVRGLGEDESGDNDDEEEQEEEAPPRLAQGEFYRIKLAFANLTTFVLHLRLFSTVAAGSV